MIQSVKDWLYNRITESGILLWLFKIYEGYFGIGILLSPESKRSKIIDEGGCSWEVLKYNGKIYPMFRESNFSNMKTRKIRNDDVLLCGYPKTGCHWMHEILSVLVTGKVELSRYGKRLGGMLDFLPEILLDSLPSPRVLNSHVHYEDLPDQIRARRTKIVVTVRSPKDTAVSYYNHQKNIDFYPGTFDNFFKLFMKGEVDYGLYFDNILHWEKAKHNQDDNPILIVAYEKLKRNPLETIKEIASFLDISITEEFALRVVEVTSFSTMKAKQPKQKQIRKGQVGDWRNWLTEAQSKQIDQVWKDRMSDCDYQPDLS